MITLKQFYFEPDVVGKNKIEPVVFKKGLNIILGERSDQSEKMNSVGKSLLIEMINFCLLSDSSSRINKIPENVLSKSTYICLEIEIESENGITNLVIKRLRDEDKPIIIAQDGNEKEFEQTSHAKEFIESLVFDKSAIERPSFRSLVSILIREEKSAFDDILRPYATKNYLDFSQLICPHLYLFGFDISLVKKMDEVLKDISSVTTTISNIKKAFKDQGIDLKTVKSYLNNLEDQVNRLNLSVDSLKPAEGLRQMQTKLKDLEVELENLVTQKISKHEYVRKIKRLPKFEQIDSDRIKIMYDLFKMGLGNTVKKSLDEVQEFHEKINVFQNQLFSQKIEKTQYEINELDTKIDRLDEEISKIYKGLNADKKIDSLKQALKEEREKNLELDEMSHRVKLLEDKQNDKKFYEKQRNDVITKFDHQILEKKPNIEKFENDLKLLHTVIAGNANCQFDIKTTQGKEYIDIDYRIDLDGGSGMDRIRTFMYDILLLLSKVTSSRHLGFLIHDNIFPSTGRDDMVKSLNYVYGEFKKGSDFQYIVTLNKDEFEAQVKSFNFDTTVVTDAIFTRKEPFLKTPYREL